MEFIHCCAPTSIILTKLTGRLTECWTLFMSPTFPPSLPNECPGYPPALDVSLHVCLCDMREDMHALTWISSLIIRLRCFSDLLAGEWRKACDQVSLKSRHYLHSELCCTLSDGAQKFLDVDCGNRFYQTPYAQRRDRDREKEPNQCQLSSSLYSDSLKFFAY